MPTLDTLMHIDPSAPDVEEFVIFAPESYRSPEILSRVQRFMECKFPDYRFSTVQEGPKQWDSFVLVPVAGIAEGRAGEIAMRNLPSEAFLGLMRATLDTFDPYVPVPMVH